MPNIRVLSYEYSGTYNDTTSIASSNDHGLKILQCLIDFRNEESAEERPIIFVGHSLGGIIIKQVKHDRLIKTWNE